ncbi:MAG: peptidylprolyl isomerase [Spirochaetia bacterium]|jgi:peptidyl-prolyl cis-trans isomerase C|nr:peptidylprolyl isomerase [Spirochaetia bacterium]
MQYRASHILVKDKALADMICKKAKGGTDFARLAREYSTCPSKSKGGDLGWFGPGQMVPEFERAVQKMGYGSISTPVHTKFGYHIIKKTGMKD